MNQPARNNIPGRQRAIAVGALACFLAVSAASTMTGCRGDRSAERPRQFFPDMDDQPKYNAQSENPVFADGRSMRPLVAGVVGFGTSTDVNDPDRRWLMIDSDAVALGANPDGSYVDRMPLRDILGVASNERLDAATVERFVRTGREQYGIFCYPCHGSTGDGKGIVGQRWATPLPDFHDPKYLPGGDLGQDGLIFHTIRNGVANPPGVEPALRMPAYGDRVSVEEAWAIVAYVRALQKTQLGQPRDVPEAILDKLIVEKKAAKNNNATQGATP